MTDTCFANNPNLLAGLHSLGAKAAHGILCYLARHKYGEGGRQQQQITPNFLHAQKGFLNQPFPFDPSLAWDAAPKRNQGIPKGGKTKESSGRRSTEHIFSSSCPCNCTLWSNHALRRCHRGQGSFGNLLPLQSSFFTSLCQCHQVPNLKSIPCNAEADGVAWIS